MNLLLLYLSQMHLSEAFPLPLHLSLSDISVPLRFLPNPNLDEFFPLLAGGAALDQEQIVPRPVAEKRLLQRIRSDGARGKKRTTRMASPGKESLKELFGYILVIS